MVLLFVCRAPFAAHVESWPLLLVYLPASKNETSIELSNFITLVMFLDLPE